MMKTSFPPLNMKVTRNTMMLLEMERLYKTGQIEDYTDDMWVLTQGEWVPFTHYLQKGN